jgi:putative transposase
MGAEQKREVIDLVRRSPLSKRRTLEELGIPRSTYFRWQRGLRQQGEVGLVDRRPQPGTVWNRLRPQAEETILREALRQPELGSRELACWVTDYGGFSVSESTVYRLLKRHGLIHEVEVVGFPAGKEYQMKTRRIKEQWQSDASYFFVVGWGWYYLISGRDDYSRFILAWDLKRDMTAQSISEVVQQAVEWTAAVKIDRLNYCVVACFRQSSSQPAQRKSRNSTAHAPPCGSRHRGSRGFPKSRRRKCGVGSMNLRCSGYRSETLQCG